MSGNLPIYIGSAEIVTNAGLLGGTDPTKSQPTAPPLGDESIPGNQIAIAAPGVSQMQLFLPLIAK